MAKKILIILLAVLCLTGCAGKQDQSSNNEQKETTDMTTSFKQFKEPKKGDEIAVFKTNMGDVKVMLFPEEAPKTVENFKTLAKEGYYDGVIFHRVINDFMIQGGIIDYDKLGGESIYGGPFEDEFSKELFNFRGALSMANAGPGTNGSQFFIVQATKADAQYFQYVKWLQEDPEYMLKDMNGNEIRLKDYITNYTVFTDDVMDMYTEIGGTPHLDQMHTVFGQVFEGLPVVDKIAAVETGEGDVPVQDVVIETVEIVEF